MTKQELIERLIYSEDYAKNHNAEVYSENNKRVLCLHYTEIVKISTNGEIQLNSGDYHTVTTKSYINLVLENLNRPERVIQKDFVWYVDNGKEKVSFEDGMYI